MRILATTILFALGLSACATLNIGDDQYIFRHNQLKKLDTAVKLQKEGKLSAAIGSLKALCAERGVPGVTDEALFRLSMLYLIDGLDDEKESIQLAQHYIERLRKEYAYSSWAGMSTPVAELLSTTAELRRQVQHSKNQNQALSKENQALAKETQELRQSIEKLKRLDLELEQKR
jgi:regulator of replication initiation timing